MASFFKNNAQAQPVSQRDLYQNKYNSARGNLLLVVIFTVINIILLVTQSDRYFLFSAFVPYFIAWEGMFFCGMFPAEYYAEEWAGIEFFDKSLFGILLAIAAVIVVIYLLCWIFSKKNKVGWLVAALVLFVADTLGMFVLQNIGADSIIDVLFHIWVVYYLIAGIHAYGKLKKLPPEEETIDGEAVEAPVEEIPAANNQSPEF